MRVFGISTWGWFWILWILMFMVGEALALAKPGKGDTLSEQFWYLRDRMSPEVYSLVLFLLGGLLLWALVHFAWQGRNG